MDNDRDKTTYLINISLIAASAFVLGLLIGVYTATQSERNAVVRYLLEAGDGRRAIIEAISNERHRRKQ